MTFRRPLSRAIAALGLATLLSFAVPLAAQAAPYPPSGDDPATRAASYPPASTGTFEVKAHPGTNRVTVNGLGKNADVTALVSGRGPAPSLGPSKGTPRTKTANLAVGKTDASGSVTFNLVFASDASGVYNISVSTPDGHSVSGSLTIPSPNASAFDWTGENIALWVVILAGAFVIAGIIALLVAVVRRRAAH